MDSFGFLYEVVLVVDVFNLLEFKFEVFVLLVVVVLLVLVFREVLSLLLLLALLVDKFNDLFAAALEAFVVLICVVVVLPLFRLEFILLDADVVVGVAFVSEGAVIFFSASTLIFLAC